MNSLLTSAAVLANDFSLDKNTVTPGVLGFLVIFAIGVVLYFLMRSLMGKLRALPRDEEGSPGDAPDVSEGSGPQAGADEVAAPAQDGTGAPRA